MVFDCPFNPFPSLRFPDGWGRGRCAAAGWLSGPCAPMGELGALLLRLLFSKNYARPHLTTLPSFFAPSREVPSPQSLKFSGKRRLSQPPPLPRSKPLIIVLSPLTFFFFVPDNCADYLAYGHVGRFCGLTRQHPLLSFSFIFRFVNCRRSPLTSSRSFSSFPPLFRPNSAERPGFRVRWSHPHFLPSKTFKLNKALTFFP